MIVFNTVDKAAEATENACSQGLHTFNWLEAVSAFITLWTIVTDFITGIQFGLELTHALSRKEGNVGRLPWLFTVEKAWITCYEIEDSMEVGQF